MKNLFLMIAAIAVLSLEAYGQNVTPPKEVQDAFSKEFKTAQNVKWEQEGNEWEAEFNLEGNEMSANYDNSGNWLETETQVKTKDLPAEIHKAINLQFNGWEIDEIEGIEKPDFTGYEIELENGETETEIVVSSTGEITIIKVSVENDDEEEDD